LKTNSISKNLLIPTYSITAIDKEAEEMGVAVQSHFFSVGSKVPWAEAGVGVIATQALVNVDFGPDGLELLRKNLSPDEALKLLLSRDEGRDSRQVAILSPDHPPAAHTGEKCIKEAGHITGENYSVQANMMLNNDVCERMATVFERSTGPLAERLVQALFAGEEAGGDIRGKQSSALLTVSTTLKPSINNSRLIDLRVEDSPEPLKELERLLNIHRAYEHANNGDNALERKDIETALFEFAKAEELLPDNQELKFWHAVSLANIGRIEESLKFFRQVFIKNDNWMELLRRLPRSGLLLVSKEDMERILGSPGVA